MMARRGILPAENIPTGILPKHKTSVVPYRLFELSTHVHLLLLVQTTNMVGVINPKVIRYYIISLFAIESCLHHLIFNGASSPHP